LLYLGVLEKRGRLCENVLSTRMDYARLNDLKAAERERAARNLAALRAQLDAEVPPKNAESDLLLATWNLRDFAKQDRKGYGDRSPESHFYIAEVLSRFDFVAVQEVNRLGEWREVVDILGPSWDWIATDVTEGRGGNGERLTYLFDKRKVLFQNIAGEIVLPANLLISANVKPKSGDKKRIESHLESGERGKVGKQFRRTPFAALFQSAWFKFEICTVHIYYGAESGAALGERIDEIRKIGKFFGRRAKEDLEEKRSLILLGDFNVVGRDHETMKALLASGFEVPPALREAPGTNVGKDKFYDQIAFHTRPGDLKYLESAGEGADARAGSVDIFKNVYTPDQFPEFKRQVEESDNAHTAKSKQDPRAYYLDWRTYQFSDHDPLWVRLKVNDSESYLQQLAR
jgi:hypothetical protein